MSTYPWWVSWSVEELSPLNPEAVAAVQLSPPEDWPMVLRHEHGPHQFTQLWWLCWYARPDLREQMNDYWFASTETHLVIHPETIAEWSEPPRWSNERLKEREWSFRIAMLYSTPLTAEQCRMIHPDTWTPVSLGFQAAQSEAHGTVLLAQIRRLDTAALERCLVEYVSRGRTLTGPCGVYLKDRAMGMTWPYRLAHTLDLRLKPFPGELMPCLLNSQDPEVRQLGVDRCRKQKERR